MSNGALIFKEHHFLNDEEVISHLRYVRDKALATLARQYEESEPETKESLVYLEVVNRCHLGIASAYKLKDIREDAGDRDDRRALMAPLRSLAR